MARRISRQQHLRGIFAGEQERYTVYDVGICGTCGCQAAATGANEGYSDCCNDRIEYDLEASETLQRVLTDAIETLTLNRKKSASLSSQMSRAKKDGDHDKYEAALQARESITHWMKHNKAEVKRAKAAIAKFAG